MSKTTSNTTPTPPPARFVSLSVLLSPGGLVATTFNPPLGRRILLRRFRAAKIPRWRSGGAYSHGGGGEPYFELSAVESWIRKNTSSGPGGGE